MVRCPRARAHRFTVRAPTAWPLTRCARSVFPAGPPWPTVLNRLGVHAHGGPRAGDCEGGERQTGNAAAVHSQRHRAGSGARATPAAGAVCALACTVAARCLARAATSPHPSRVLSSRGRCALTPAPTGDAGAPHARGGQEGGPPGHQGGAAGHYRAVFRQGQHVRLRRHGCVCRLALRASSQLRLAAP